jgi:hypothetical protein
LVEIIEASVGKQFSGDDLYALQDGLNNLRNNESQVVKQLTLMFTELSKFTNQSMDILIRVFHDEKWTIL